MEVQPSALNTVRRVAVSAMLAVLAVVDRQQDEVADLEVLVLHLGSNGSDGAGAFVAEDGWVRADWDVALLEDYVL